MIGISSALIGFVLFLKTRDNGHQRYQRTFYAHSKLATLEENGIFAKLDKNFNLLSISNEFGTILGITEGNLLDILSNCVTGIETIETIENALKHNKTFNDVLKLKIANKILHLDTFIYKLDKRSSHYVIRCSDITAYIKTQQTNKDELFIDKFTKLPTRLKLLDDLLKAKKENRTHAYTLVYIQIDDYEEFNEFFGIDVGHKLLKEIAKWLQDNLPTKNTQLYKFDHNNFAMFSTSRISLAELETYLRQLHNKIQHDDFLIQETYHDISFTKGVARGKTNLLKHAYLALKEAQKTNKSYKIFNKNNILEAKYLQNIQTNKNIKEAILEDRIVPFFQPILNIKTNEVEKFESLMRIQNRDNTHQKPADFLDIAKQSKLYPQLTKAMIAGSLKRLEFLQYPITINIAIDDILNPSVSSFILRKLEKHSFSQMVTFEILETHEILNYTRVANFIKKIKAFGCLVAIDDFGSGYSNFEQVLKLDIDYIKIDGSLIKNINTNKENEIVTKTIITFAQELGVKTIAEFVSSEAIFDKVKSLGIDYAQGYYIGKPAPMASAIKS